MVIKTYFDKDTVIVQNSTINTGLNPISELFYGGSNQQNSYSRLLCYFNENTLKSLYTGGTFTDLTKLKHTLRMTNTASMDSTLLNTEYNNKQRTSSFDLIVFPINQPWDEGVGYHYSNVRFVNADATISLCPANWQSAQTGISWSGGTGVYSGTSSVIATQHFDHGDENLEMDITDYVNSIITGNTNYGFGIAFTRAIETTETTKQQYVGFFSRQTQTLFEPHIETNYSNHINDDRNDFYLSKTNKLYLYVNLGGEPTNLDSLPSVIIKDNAGAVYSSITSSAVTHVTKGVYSIDVKVTPTSDFIDSTVFYDVWSGISIGGQSLDDVRLQFALKDSSEYYQLGSLDTEPKKVSITISGVKMDETIKRGDIRKVFVSTRIPYTMEQKQKMETLEYRIYAKEGINEYTIVDYHPIEQANNMNYFLLDTNSFLPGTYYIDIKASSNMEVETSKVATKFIISSNSNERYAQ